MGLKLKNGYQFEKEKITSIISNNREDQILKDLISDIKGYKEKEISFISDNINNVFTCKTIREEFTYKLEKYNYKKIDKKIKDALKLVKLPIDYLDREIITLSDSEKTLILFAMQMLLNPKLIVIEDIFKYLDNQSEKYLIRLLKRLKNNYHKTIIFISNNIDVILNITDNYVLFKNNDLLISGSKKNLLLNSDILVKEGFALPKIIEFINYVKDKKNISLDINYDIKELMKDIYRNVK